MDRLDKREKMSSINFSTIEWNLFMFFLKYWVSKELCYFYSIGYIKKND